MTCGETIKTRIGASMRIVAALSILGSAVGCDGGPEPAAVPEAEPDDAASASTGHDDDADDDDADDDATSGGDASTTGAPPDEPASTSGDEDPTDGASTGVDGGGSTGDEEPDLVYTGPGCGITPACDKGEYVGSVRVESSAQIDQIAGYTSITGWLEVTDSDLECLDFLYCMQTVGRNLSIYGNTALKDTRGLDNLVALGTSTTALGYDDWDGSLVISNNAGLVEINGFNALVETQESLNINRNDFLQRIEGFASFRRVQHNLVVRDNPVLESVEGLTGLEVVLGNFLVTQNPNLCLSEVNVLGDALLEFSGLGTTAANDTGC